MAVTNSISPRNTAGHGQLVTSELLHWCDWTGLQVNTVFTGLVVRVLEGVFSSESRLVWVSM